MGDFPPLDDPAGKAALLTVIAAAVWKIWLRLKHDSRNDKAESRDHASEDHITGSYDAIIKQLRDEVNRLAATVSSLSLELDAERKARREAQISSVELQSRVISLENRLKAAGLPI